MFFRRIQHRLMFFFALLVVAVFFISGWLLQWTIHQIMEAELGRKLTAVASASSVQFDESEIEFLLKGVGPWTGRRLRERLLRLKKTTGVKRIYLFDLKEKSLLDTEEKIERGTPYFRIRFYRREMEKIQEGKSAYSILFRGIDDLPTMTGYAPLFYKEKVVGGIGVDGSVTFLGAVNRLRRRLYLIGILGTLVAVGVGILMAGTITRPIRKLVRVSKQIGQGDYSEPIPLLTKDEIGRLASTMEEMRKGVVERERELKTMLAGVAHEIRNPLGGIELFAGLLADKVSHDKKAEEHLDRIQREISHLKDIVNSFLEYARPKEPHREDCQLSETLTEAGLLLEDQMKKQGISLLIPEEINSITVLADPTHLKRIVLNLFQNAVQAMPDGGEIEIRWSQKYDSVFLFIKDKGRGIPQDVQEKIFVPFFTTREKGTGLGLSIVKGLAEANGGSIRLIQSDKYGTEFEVQFERYSNKKV